MTLARGRLRPPGAAGSGTSRPRETALLAVALVAGLVAVAPATAWLLQAVGLPSPFPLLVGVGVVGGSYGLYVLLAGRVATGAAVATVVTATFAAEVPLAGGTGDYPGSLGPELWLVHPPLFLLAGLLAVRGEFSLGSVDRVEYALGAFVLWSVVVALVGPVPRPDVALFYSVFSLYALVAFGAVARSVSSGLVSFRGVLSAFLVAVGGHVAFAVVQLANQGVLGLSVLGETTRATSHTVVPLGPLGAFDVGVFVSGFTGSSAAVAMLVILAVPIALAVAARRTGAERLGLLTAVVAATAVLRFTEKDAARAAAVITIALLGAFLLWEYRSRPGRSAGWSRAAGRWLAPVVLAVGALFLPSTVAPDGSTGSTDGGGGTSGVAGGEGSGSVVAGERLSVPFFDLNTLDVRLQQYVVGLDLVAEHPLSGIGGANFTYAAARYDAAALEGISMHNLYLSLLVGTGVPGFVLYSAAVLAVLWSGVELLRSVAVDRLLVAGVLAALVGYLAAVFWMLPLRFTYVLPFWMLSGALVGLARRSRRSAADGAPGG